MINYLLFIVCYRSAELYVELGKYGIPAKHHESIALIYSKVKKKGVIWWLSWGPIVTIYNTVILVRSVFGQKFSLYREGSSLFRFKFVPNFSEGQNII